MNATTDETIMMYYVKGLDEDIEHMVDYIASITSHPILHQASIDKEKQAVIDELLTYGSDPTSKLDGVLNHLLFNNGLEFKDDWQLQIQNLKRLGLEDIRRVYREEFTPANVVFVVSGAFSPNKVLAHFRKALRRSTVRGQRAEAHGFTLAHEIRHVPDTMATTLVVLALPSAVYADAVLVPLAAAVLGDILFHELRTKRQLVYGAKVNAATTTCGTRLQVKIYVRPAHLKECLRVAVAQIKECCQTIPETRLAGVKKRLRQEYAVDVPDAEFYATQYITSPDFILSRKVQRSEYEAATAQTVAATLRSIVVWEHAVCVYEGQKDVHLTWADMGLK
jgi:predicted Zn-dependent peptidase